MNNNNNENKNDIYLNKIKKRLQKFKLDKNIIKKENINNSVKQKECAIIKNNELIKDVISKKYKIKIKEEKEIKIELKWNTENGQEMFRFCK